MAIKSKGISASAKRRSLRIEELRLRRERWKNEARAGAWWRVFSKACESMAVDGAAGFADRAMAEYDKRFPDVSLGS